MSIHAINDPERLHALIDAILLIETDAELDELLSRIVETASRLVGARYGALGVLASDGERLARFITFGLDAEQRKAIGLIPRGRGVLGESIRQRSVLRIDELNEHPGSVGVPANHPPMRRFLGVPVITGDNHVFGNLYLTDPFDGEPFDEEDSLLVAAFGRAAGLVIDQAMMRNQVRDLTLSEERERLARDLHDTVIQRLFGVGLALQMSLAAVLDDGVRTRINNVLDELDTTIHEIRTTIFEIDQDQGGGETIQERISALTYEVASRLGVHADVRVAAGLDEKIGPRCAHHTVQALREILSNIVRHSKASAVQITVGRKDNLVELIVRDNGVGFIPNVGPGRGLRNLASRARELGGDCAIKSEIGRGTMVTWTANRLD
ncbi:MAG: GAF domain-containing protein [Acidimicrobiaceae bacterium]|nr:GAF domain-containing protein [Acidimicrobiaceae bacterium]